MKRSSEYVSERVFLLVSTLTLPLVHWTGFIVFQFVFLKKSANLIRTYLPKGAETQVYSRNLLLLIITP